MSSSSTRQNRAEAAFHRHKESGEKYKVGTESMTVDDKLKFLKEIGKPELIDLFKEWKPRTSARKQRGAPLDQRVSITVTSTERALLDQELRQIKAAGEKTGMSQFIRNRAIGSADINGWKDTAEKALREIEDTVTNQSKLRKEKTTLITLMDEEGDDESAFIYEQKIEDINRRLGKLVAKNEKRNNRLSGRMTMAEAETVKWRAQQLCISTSDYLRMMIFDLAPDSSADSHMSLDAKRRFYLSIIQVAKAGGFGTPPKIYECSQCINYMDEIRRLRSENQQLRSFSS